MSNSILKAWSHLIGRSEDVHCSDNALHVTDVGATLPLDNGVEFTYNKIQVGWANMMTVITTTSYSVLLSDMHSYLHPVSANDGTGLANVVEYMQLYENSSSSPTSRTDETNTLINLNRNLSGLAPSVTIEKSNGAVLIGTQLLNSVQSTNHLSMFPNVILKPNTVYGIVTTPRIDTTSYYNTIAFNLTDQYA
jgi:hypothetical protein